MEEHLKRSFPKPPDRYDGLRGMQEWFTVTIKPYCKDVGGMLIRWEGAFAEARRNNIKRLSMNFGASEIDLIGGMDAFKSIIGGFHLKYCPNTVFEPEITYISACNVQQEAEKIDCYISSVFFKSAVVQNHGKRMSLFSTKNCELFC